MLQVWTYSLISVMAVSLISLVGAVTLALRDSLLKKVIFLLVSFSAGALLGSAFFHLMPELIGNWGYNSNTSFWLVFGVVLFFILEKYIHWRHCHEPDCDQHPYHLAMMNIFGDGLHNFLDGVIIASSYLISLPLGITTTIAIILHEIPQEIGEFAILLHSGFSKIKAIFYNLFSAAVAILGTILGILLGESTKSFTVIIIPIATASFFYIAMSDLIPELHKETKLRKSLIQLFCFIFGIGLMYLFTLFE